MNRYSRAAIKIALGAINVDGPADDEAAVVTDQKQRGGGDRIHIRLTASGMPAVLDKCRQYHLGFAPR